MSLFLALPILAATGIYNPQVVDRHGHCLAEQAPLPRFIVRHPRHPRHLLIIGTLRGRSVPTETLPRGAKATATRRAKFAISRRCAQCRSGRRS